MSIRSCRRERHKVEIRYRTALGEATEASDAAGGAGAGARRQEMRRGVTLVGPHRDDLAIELDGVDVRAFGSRGQQRLLALALRLAEVLPVTEAAGSAPCCCSTMRCPSSIRSVREQRGA